MTRLDSVEERMAELTEAGPRVPKGQQATVRTVDLRLLLAENEQLRAELERKDTALESALDAMVHRPVDSELFRLSIKEIEAALAPNQTDAPEGETDGE